MDNAEASPGGRPGGLVTELGGPRTATVGIVRVVALVLGVGVLFAANLIARSVPRIAGAAGILCCLILRVLHCRTWRLARFRNVD